MKIKNKILVLSMITTLILSSSVIYIGCSLEESSTAGEASSTVEEVQITDKPVAETVETTPTTEVLQNNYSSSSADFDNYSFICPEGWKLYETASGKRVILENSDGVQDTEYIFIFVEDISADETINSSSDVVDLYTDAVIADETVEFFEEEDIKLGGTDSKIYGYSYQSKLDSSNGEKTTYTDYFTFLEQKDFLYSIKFVSSSGNEDSL